MYTQCAKCETVFRLSADVLRAAGGQVRCGRCGEVFNALTRLEETPAAFIRGESPLQLEARADEILQSDPGPAAKPSDAEPAEEAINGDEMARLEVIAPPEDDLASEMSLEFTLPPDDLDRVFVESAPNPLAVLTAARQSLAGTPHAIDRPAEPPEPTTPAPVVDPPTVAASKRATPAAPEPPAPQPAAPQPAAPKPAAPKPAAPITPVVMVPPAGAVRPDAIVAPAQSMRAVPSAMPIKVHRESKGGHVDAEFPMLVAPRRRIPKAAWVLAAVALSALLAVQFVYENGGWSALRVPLIEAPPAPVLSVYQLRQWGVTGDPNAQGTLRVRASILNATSNSQPYPLLRVTLADRFGNRVGRREFEAVDYLGKAPAGPMGPGERADAMLDILDPGKQAEGFEIDLCLRVADGKLSCTGDTKPRTT